MREQQRPEAQLYPQQHKQHQQRNGHHDVRGHHHHKQHPANEGLAAKTVAVERHRGQGANQGGEGGREDGHRQRVLRRL
ncbi:hypothetical protein D3C76_1767230 [compost metagenome]